MYVAGIGAYPTNTSKDIFTNMVAGQGGSWTFGATGIALAINATATFNNNTPICSVSTPTAKNHLTRKDYINNNFIYKTGSVPENINGVKNFLNNLSCSSSLISNNITAPSSKIAGDNNIYVNLLFHLVYMV